MISIKNRDILEIDHIREVAKIMDIPTIQENTRLHITKDRVTDLSTEMIEMIVIEFYEC